METSGTASGLRVPKFGLNKAPEGPTTTSTVDNTRSTIGTVVGGDIIINLDDKWDGGTGGIEYSINDIVLALKNVGILKD